MIKGNEAESKNGSVTESQRKINMLKKQIVLVLFFSSSQFMVSPLKTYLVFFYH